MWWNESKLKLFVEKLLTLSMQTLARGQVSHEMWLIFNLYRYRLLLFNLFVSPCWVSGQGRGYYCHGDGGSQLTISRVPGQDGSLPCQLHPHNERSLWASQSGEAPPTPVSRFPPWRPLIGQAGPRAPSDWSALIGFILYCCCSDQMSPGHRYQVHIRAEFNILTLSTSDTSPIQIDCHSLSCSHKCTVLYSKYTNCWH